MENTFLSTETRDLGGLYSVVMKCEILGRKEDGRRAEGWINKYNDHYPHYFLSGNHLLYPEQVILGTRSKYARIWRSLFSAKVSQLANITNKSV